MREKKKIRHICKSVSQFNKDFFLICKFRLENLTRNQHEEQENQAEKKHIIR